MADVGERATHLQRLHGGYTAVALGVERLVQIGELMRGGCEGELGQVCARGEAGTAAS